MTSLSFAAAFDRGIEYEGLRESINIEIAHQNALVNESGEDSALGRQHREAIAQLAGVLRRLAPGNTAAIEIASLMLEFSRKTRLGNTAA